MGKKILSCLIVLMAFVLVTSVSAKEKVYINGIDANFPPFAYVDKNGVPDGFDVKAVDWIAKEMGFKVTHKPMDWDGIIPSLKARKIDFIASGMSVTDKRKQEVNFTVPYWVITQVLVVPKDSTLTVDQVFSNGNKVGVQRGTSEATWMKENLIQKGKNFVLREYDSSPLSVEDVVNGRIIAAAMDDSPAKDAVRKRPVKILGSFGMHDENFAYAVRKQDKELLKMLNEGLKKLMADPYWEELKKTYKP
ncbi:MAG TPA: amino acid ABC transporter substrate-binding protein [Deltaproteobacteria bacterium]|nr:amino acid ABC transporter substrate-binding protein [Deltaproteobacteria bacterium]